jgi:hypothetical protein
MSPLGNYFFIKDKGSDFYARAQSQVFTMAPVSAELTSLIYLAR